MAIGVIVKGGFKIAKSTPGFWKWVREGVGELIETVTEEFGGKAVAAGARYDRALDAAGDLWDFIRGGGHRGLGDNIFEDFLYFLFDNNRSFQAAVLNGEGGHWLGVQSINAFVCSQTLCGPFLMKGHDLLFGYGAPFEDEIYRRIEDYSPDRQREIRRSIRRSERANRSADRAWRRELRSQGLLSSSRGNSFFLGLSDEVMEPIGEYVSSTSYPDVDFDNGFFGGIEEIDRLEREQPHYGSAMSAQSMVRGLQLSYVDEENDWPAPHEVYLDANVGFDQRVNQVEDTGFMRFNPWISDAAYSRARFELAHYLGPTHRLSDPASMNATNIPIQIDGGIYVPSLLGDAHEKYWGGYLNEAHDLAQFSRAFQFPTLPGTFS